MEEGGPDRCVVRSRGGLATKIPAVVDANGLAVRLAGLPARRQVQPHMHHHSNRTTRWGQVNSGAAPVSWTVMDLGEQGGSWLRSRLMGVDLPPMWDHLTGPRGPLL